MCVNCDDGGGNPVSVRGAGNPHMCVNCDGKSAQKSSFTYYDVGTLVLPSFYTGTGRSGVSLRWFPASFAALRRRIPDSVPEYSGSVGHALSLFVSCLVRMHRGFSVCLQIALRRCQSWKGEACFRLEYGSIPDCDEEVIEILLNSTELERD